MVEISIEARLRNVFWTMKQEQTCILPRVKLIGGVYIFTTEVFGSLYYGGYDRIHFNGLGYLWIG